MPWRLIIAAMTLALFMHLATHRWTIQVDDSGLCVDRSSWLWPRRTRVPTSQVQALYFKLSYIQSAGADNSTEYHSLWWVTPQRTAQRLSPALPHADTARAVGLHVLQALAHHQGRFEAGTPSHRTAPHSAPWPCAAAWLVWGLLVYAGFQRLTPH